MVFGPNMQNFADVVRGFLAQDGGGAGAATRRNWKRRWPNCWPTTRRREQLGRNALKVVHENLGAIERTVDMIVEQLGQRRNLRRRAGKAR